LNLPPHAYVPGQTPRHDPSLFKALHDSVHSEMTTSELAQSAAWRAGWVFFENGFYWEAHEALEPVWMATSPNSVERHAVQALIQTANAALKERMNRPNAVLRLCDLAEAYLQACGPNVRNVMGLPLSELESHIEALRKVAK
jgi:predicted metal-dependent hydrolase